MRYKRRPPRTFKRRCPHCKKYIEAKLTLKAITEPVPVIPHSSVEIEHYEAFDEDPMGAARQAREEHPDLGLTALARAIASHYCWSFEVGKKLCAKL